MKIKSIAIVVGSIFLVASLGFSQPSDKNSPLTWSDCVSLTLQKNPDLMSSKHALEANKASYYGSYNGFLPQINLSHSYSDSDSASNVSSTGSASDSANWQTKASANMNILNMSQIASFKSSQSLLSQAEANLWKTSSLIRFNLRKAFNQLLFVQKNIEVSGTIVKMRQDEAQLVSLRYESGKESKGNMLSAQAQFLQAKADLSQSLRDLRTAQRVLCQQLGLNDFVAVNISSSILDTQEPPELPKDEQLLLKNRPDVSLQEAVVKSAEAALSQSSSSLWPSLSANYSKFSSGVNEFSDFQSNWGAVLNYPLFAGGPTATYFAISNAKNNLEKANQDLRSIRYQALVDVETSWSDFVGAVEQSKVQEALLEAARQRNDEANVRYDSGLITYDSWEIIASDRINQERQAIQAQLNALTAEATWQKALGKQIEE